MNNLCFLDLFFKGLASTEEGNHLLGADLHGHVLLYRQTVPLILPALVIIIVFSFLLVIFLFYQVLG